VSICPDTPTGTAPRNWTPAPAPGRKINRKRSSGILLSQPRRALGVGASRQNHIPGHHRHVIVEQVIQLGKAQATVVLLPASWV